MDLLIDLQLTYARHTSPLPSPRSPAWCSPRRRSGASVTKAGFGATKDGVAVDEYTLTNDKGASVKFISYGGIITEINVPDRWGRLGNIVLGFKTSANTRPRAPISVH